MIIVNKIGEMSDPIPEGNEGFRIATGAKFLILGFVAVPQNYGVISFFKIFPGKGGHLVPDHILGTPHQLLTCQGTLSGHKPKHGEGEDPL